MSILIFGGAGFVGRHYTEHFLTKGKISRSYRQHSPTCLEVFIQKKWKLFNPYKFKKKFIFVNQDCRSLFQKKIEKKI